MVRESSYFSVAAVRWALMTLSSPIHAPGPLETGRGRRDANHAATRDEPDTTMENTMYSAYLRTGDIWKRETDASKILAHDGECVMCDTKEDEADIGLTLAGMEPERHVSPAYSQSVGFACYEFVVTDDPYFPTITDDAIETLEKTGKIIVGSMSHDWVHHSNKNRVYYIAGLNAKQRDGVIAEQDEDNIWTLTQNMELWTIANKKVDKLRHKRKVAVETAKVTHPEVVRLGYHLGYSCGFQFGNSGTSNLIGGILIHDQYKGQEETDKKIMELAQKWVKYKKENSLKFLEKKWLTVDEIRFLNLRFKKITQEEEETTELTAA